MENAQKRNINIHSVRLGLSGREAADGTYRKPDSELALQQPRQSSCHFPFEGDPLRAFSLAAAPRTPEQLVEKSSKTLDFDNISYNSLLRSHQ